MRGVRAFRGSRISGAVLLLGAAGIHFACNDNDLGLEKRRPNRSPETVLASGPPDSTYGVDYKVQLFWSGSDADGSIDHYDYILVDHTASEDSIATTDPTAANRVVVRVPSIDDPRWTSTAQNDTIIVTRADTLRVDPAPPDSLDDLEREIHDALIRGTPFERWHTFFVRAVDNEGLPDATPDYRSFNAHNVAPVVYLTSPVRRGAEFRGPQTIVFNWDGYDPLDGALTQPPIAARWTIVPSFKDTSGYYRGLPDTLYHLPPSAWSRWRAWDARDGSGRSAVVRNLRPAGSTRDEGFYLFAVQALDEGGAKSMVFDWKLFGKNNCTPVQVDPGSGPVLTVSDPFLGTFFFTNVSRPLAIDVAAGQPIHWSWRASAAAYGGHIVGYRFSWDLRNPDNDEEWEQNWSQTATSAPIKVFQSGTHVFFLEARDNAEAVTRARIELTVRQVTRRRDFLIVDDSLHPQGDNDPNELREDQRWLAILDSLQEDTSFEFDKLRDVYDVRERNRLKPPLSLVFDYKTIVWRVVQSSQLSALKDIVFFRDPFVAGQNNAGSFNYLNLYLDNGGEMWVCGQQPSFSVWPLLEDRQRESPIFPANLVQWNLDAHPDEDSVGTLSFLYRMGVEAVDLGAGGLAPAVRGEHLNQACLGLRRSGGPGGGTRQFESSRVLDHVHKLVVQGTDVETPPFGGVDYTTDALPGHAHTVHLEQAQLVALRGGERIQVETASSDLPAPHTHVFSLADRFGIWGAPPALDVDGSWALPPVSVNPLGGRVNVEIYNMPAYLAQQMPALQPPSDRVLSLYLYRSPTRADHDHGVLYPATADEQPVFILARGRAQPHYTRAWCGFEPWRLTFRSHLALARYVLLQTMQLGQPEPQ